MVNLSTQFLEAPGCKLAWDQMGPELQSSAERLLVLVNGFQRTRQDFRALRRRLHQADPHLVSIALDNRGCGETVNTADFDLTDMARDVLRLAGQVQQNLRLEKFALLGISMGGMIAQVAAAQSESVSHLFLVSTTAGGARRVWPGAAGSERVPESFSGWPVDADEMMTKMRSYFGSRFLKSSPLLVASMAKTVSKSHSAETALQGAQQQYTASRHFDGLASLKALSRETRVLVVTGEEDSIIPAANSEILVGLIPRSVLKVYPEVGHLILVEEPEVFARDVGDFLQS